ncbi:hypothetical protein AACH10_08255 [Ideonella sp. DXS22W]|uniref:Uncharacterized protein n=1 Tax=Pseudaquabacterium inlustre TaxID=2984192 RepID=A0ABU9CEC3_9BURK
MTPNPNPNPTLAASIDALRAGTLDVHALVAQWRAAAAAWPGLPPRYAAVLEKLLAPLEASAMFGEESCSFSRADLADTLLQWLQHVQAAAPGGPGDGATSA